MLTFDLGQGTVYKICRNAIGTQHKILNCLTQIPPKTSADGSISNCAQLLHFPALTAAQSPLPLPNSAAGSRYGTPAPGPAIGGVTLQWKGEVSEPASPSASGNHL